MSAGDIIWVRAPQQARSEATLARFLVEYRQRRGLRRELVRRHRVDAAFRARSIAVGTSTIAPLAALLAARADEVTVGPPLQAADMVNRLLFGALDQHATFADEGPAVVHLTDEILTRELTRAILAYLTSPA